MISLQREELEQYTVKDLIIPSEKVAHVQGGNPLEHALLVLVKSGYSAVPVLDPQYKLKGSISKTIILDNMLGIEEFELERLSNITVQEVMKTDIPLLNLEDTFSTGLDAVTNHPFVCVVDDEGFFEGILTRRAILKRLKRHLHTYNQHL
ncbi:cyclic-di-AMP-binding protein CbpB [Pontibacillus litoralis]|uniref:CBS domain-containing protein n=1 Tax=Pontibacillus litoralis JSM 072002 TaxID=1385512 RepID=A0A0A5GC81_9BACI|nr:cyclic-di-AMP-binding protein CbpB [Pontibacillus litoralis]KGX88808.1 hypothetical protein N784_00200 [Pontibacillus litoralis JSM 072002]